MRQRKGPPESVEEGAPAWMNTYGDMVTLMLTFFVLLFSFSTINAKKWKEIVVSFSGVSALEGGSGLADGSALPPEAGGLSDNAKKFSELYEQIKGHIDEKGLEASLEVKSDGTLITLTMKDSALFDSGKATIKSESVKIISDIMEIIQKYDGSIRMMRIEGHTDNRPISNAAFSSNWDLSVSRAVNVLEFLLNDSRISPDKLSATGYGEYHPVDTNDTAEGRAKNRRVDFIIEGIK